MGDSKRQRKKYSTPSHPWEKERIVEEKALLEEYGLKNKKEIWKSHSLLKNFTTQAKNLIADNSKQGELEKKQMLAKATSLGLISPGSTIEDVLSISNRDILDRRIQTILVKKGLARTMKQARQFITHGHVTISGRMITSPSHLLSISDENNLVFSSSSSLSDENHPARFVEEAKPEEAAASKSKKESDSVKEEKSKEKVSKKKSSKKPKEEKPKEEKPKEEKPKEENKDIPKEDKKEAPKEEKPEEESKEDKK